MRKLTKDQLDALINLCIARAEWLLASLEALRGMPTEEEYEAEAELLEAK